MVGASLRTTSVEGATSVVGGRASVAKATSDEGHLVFTRLGWLIHLVLGRSAKALLVDLWVGQGRWYCTRRLLTTGHTDEGHVC